jgi:signal transduction histidine kinase
MSRDALDERRLERLVEAGRSLVSELDLEVVLRRLLETARDLTRARYAALGVLDEARSGLERFITVGIDDETRREIGELPHGRGVLGVLISDPRPLRLRDVSEHPRSYGFPPAHPEMKTFLGVPVIVRGAAFGNLYLTEKEGGGEFTEADEEAAVVLSEWAAIAIENARLHAREQHRHSIAAAERERRRWARELHDETLQGLGAVRVLLSSALHAGSGEALERASRETVERLRQEIESLRGLITEVRPAALDELGLGAAIESLVERFTATESIGVETHISLAFESGRAQERLDIEVETTVYRAVQEALTNVARHSRAEEVRLSVEEYGGTVEVLVVDDGVGFEPGAGGAGVGLLGMRERITMIGGTLQIQSAPGAGTRIQASIPAYRGAPAEAT